MQLKLPEFLNKENKNNSGVYRILNIVNDHAYYGSTSNFAKRKQEHFGNLALGKHENPCLRNAYFKYGKDNFIFQICEECLKEDNLLLEQIYLDCYFDNQIKCYNINCNAIMPPSRKGKKVSEEVKKKFSINSQGNKNPFYGKHHTEEAKRKNREAHLGKCHPHTEETKRKIAKLKYIPVYQLDKITNEIIAEFSSIKEAGRQTNICHENIGSCCKNRRKTAGGYYWKYQRIRK